MRIKHYLLFLFILPSIAFSQKIKFGREDLSLLPDPPAYDQLFYWAAHPDKKDSADVVPGKSELSENQSNAQVDVFFVHPTIYMGKQQSLNPWNADLLDAELNAEVDQSTIKNQASVFNGSTRVYVPRYRQAHISVFYVNDSLIKAKSLNIAYQDVKEAFEYYLKNWNKGRPFILASHSQGTVHAARLVKDYIEGGYLKEQLVALYLIGMPLKIDLFENIPPPCRNAIETSCWTSWNTFKKGYYPNRFNIIYDNALSTNPLNWKIDNTYASRNENLGGVLWNFEKIIPKVTDAQNYQGILWSEKPHFPGRIFLLKRRYHIADYNLFYINIRKNVKTRVNSYLSSH